MARAFRFLLFGLTAAFLIWHFQAPHNRARKMDSGVSTPEKMAVPAIRRSIRLPATT